MDMKYDASTPYGQSWAGYIDERTAYQWDPATAVTGVTESNIVGVEAPLWTEYIPTLPAVEYMAFPRLAGYAEIAWSPSAGRSWDEYKVRIGSQRSRLESMGVNVYESSEIPWH
jgi:hexosaminidase